MCLRLICSALAAILIGETVAAAALPATRRWTDRTGKFSVEAEYVETKSDGVVLKNAKGATITVPLARLSDADQEYLKTRTTPVAKAAVNGGPQPNLVFPDAVTEPPSWDDGKAPFDLAAYLRPIAAEENAAPLYLEALYEFAPSEMIDLLYPNLTQEEQKQRWESFRPRRKEEMRLEDAWEKDPKSVDGKEVDAWLANFDVGFEKLAAAQQRLNCMFQPGRSIHSLWPHSQACRQVGRVVNWRTRHDLARGDVERPMQDMKMLLRLNRDLRVRGGMVSQFVGVALDGGCCERVPMILNAPNINVDQCDRLLALFAEHETDMVDQFVEGNRSEYITSRQALHDLQHRTGSFDTKTLKEVFDIRDDMNSPLACIKVFTDLGFNEKKLADVTTRLQSTLLPGAWQGGKMLSDENYAKEVEAVNRFFATILKLAEQPNYLSKGEADLKAAEALIDETTLASFLIPPENAVLESIRRNEARLRGTQCLIALRRWQFEHADAPPPDLATIVKAAGMPGVPIDPYSDEPLRMAIIDGKPVIYSVGPDGKDDKAQVEWNLAPKGPGDFIFRLETTAQ